MRAAVLLLIGALWLASMSATAWAQASPYVYQRNVGDYVTLAWTHDKACPSQSSFHAFEFRGIRYGSTTDIRLQGQTTDLQVPIQAAMEGQLYFQVRTVCMRDGSPLYSDYANSTDPAVALVDGEAQGWVVRYSISSPSEFLISRPPPPGPPELGVLDEAGAMILDESG